METMISIVLFAIFIMVYSVIIEVFTILFRLTGLTQEKARTQVISLLTNSGFTTSESEIVLHSKKRRKLAQLTMLFGYSFSVIIVSIVVNIFFTFNRSEMNSIVVVVVTSVIIMVILFIVMRLKIIRNRFDVMIEKIGNKIMFGKKSNLLVLIDNYSGKAMAEIFLEFVPELIDKKPLADTRLKESYDIQILVLKRNGEEAGAVDGNTVLTSGDIIVVFGNYKNIRSVFEHPEKG